MRKMRKFLNILFLCTLALGLSSCEPDDGYNYPLLEIYDVYVAGDRLSGVLYVDGHMDGPVMLERQY